jgi:nitroreductase
MSFLELAARRYSCRAYRPDPVPPERLEAVLEAARLAPSACNRQPFRIDVLATAGHEAALALVYRAPWLVQAPLVVVVSALPDEAWSRRDGMNYAVVDATIAMDHLILAAADLGLGTCWVAAFDPAALRKLLALPVGAEPVALTPLGSPADPPPAKERQPLANLVRDRR